MPFPMEFALLTLLLRTVPFVQTRYHLFIVQTILPRQAVQHRLQALTREPLGQCKQKDERVRKPARLVEFISPSLQETMTNAYLEVLDLAMRRRFEGITNGSEDIEDTVSFVKDEVISAFNRGMLCATADLNEEEASLLAHTV